MLLLRCLWKGAPFRFGFHDITVLAWVKAQTPHHVSLVLGHFLHEDRLGLDIRKWS